MTYGCVYKITNLINGRVYVGQTIRPLKKRWSQHVSDANVGKSMLISRAIRKYGSDGFSIEVVEECIDQDTLNVCEIQWIMELGTLNGGGYNISLHPGRGPMAEETKKRISQARMGHPTSEATRKKISVSKKGQCHTEETKRKISQSKMGQTLSEEHKKKIGAGSRSWIRDEEYRVNCAKAQTKAWKQRRMTYGTNGRRRNKGDE